MEIKKITPEMRKQLREPLPPEAVKPHPTKSYLSSIKAIFVTERMNTVFGVGSWQLRTERISENDKGMVVVKVTLTIPEYGVYYECFGGNDNGGAGSKNFDLGDAYKGATTDAITKIGSWLEIGIDVFKGEANAPKGDNKAAEGQAEKQWLNKWTTAKKDVVTDKYKEVVVSAAEGIFPTMGDIKEAFKLSKEVEAELVKDIKSAKEKLQTKN